MRIIYWWLAHLGLMTVSAAVVLGFRRAAGAPAIHYLYDLLLYGAFIAVHLVMTRPAWKRLFTGNAEGTPAERRAYIAVAVMTWLAVYAFHWPVPGPAFAPAPWVQYLGLCGVFLGFFAFLEGATFQTTSGLLGVPGATMGYSHGAETPLMTGGSYASVRHPMYRGFLLMLVASLLVHPNAAQLFWGVMIGLTFVVFVPVEEAQLIAKRGEQYRLYMEQTRYRLIRGVW
jgi:protein-S-isoprenylcysteine O-methyltransferase Ste14